MQSIVRAAYALKTSHAAAATLALRLGCVVLYDRHMTTSVGYRFTVVGNGRLLLKARPRSAASLAGSTWMEAGRLFCHSEALLCGTTCQEDAGCKALSW